MGGSDVASGESNDGLTSCVMPDGIRWDGGLGHCLRDEDAGPAVVWGKFLHAHEGWEERGSKMFAASNYEYTLLSSLSGALAS
jgi:hypothetical protein